MGNLWVATRFHQIVSAPARDFHLVKTGRLAQMDIDELAPVAAASQGVMSAVDAPVFEALGVDELAVGGGCGA